MKQALIIGIDKYPNQPLHGCVNDAEALAKVLNYNGDAEKSVNFEVKLATNVQSRAELRGMIRNLFDYDADIVLLYFSGHGYVNETGGYIVTPDGQTNDPGISMDEILNQANQSDIKTKIIILDCCNAGAIGLPANLPGTSFLRKGMIILTSSREKEPAKETDGHGIFTSLLIDALNGGAADLKGDITPANIYAHIDTAIGNWGQRPIFRANVTRFTPVRKIKPLVDIEVVKKIATYFPVPEHKFQLDPTFEWTNTDMAIAANVEIFKELQSMNRVGLLVPAGATDMYFAAMKSKFCRLTALGLHYWRLAKDKRI